MGLLFSRLKLTMSNVLQTVCILVRQRVLCFSLLGEDHIKTNVLFYHSMSQRTFHFYEEIVTVIVE